MKKLVLNCTKLGFINLVLLLCACASLPNNEQRQESHTLSDTQNTTLAKSIQDRRKLKNIDSSKSGLKLLDDGVDALVARAALARLAEKTLDVQYYLYHSDVCGALLTNELVDAADRGVRVRLLLDDMDMSGRDNSLVRLNAHPNIQIRIFNPFIRGKSRTGQFLTRFGTVTRRMHNKSMTADNQMSIIGGRNVGDEYFGANPNLAFGDLDVVVTSPAAKEVSTSFDLYWNNELSYPVERLLKQQPTKNELNEALLRLKDFIKDQENTNYAKALENSTIVANARAGKITYYWGDVTILYDHPMKISTSRDETDYHLGPQLAPYITNVEKELIVISPYFVPGKEGVDFFKSLREKGIAVRILTNSLASNDVSIVHSGYAKYRKSLLKAGVELYELDKSVLGRDFERDKKRKTREGISGSKASLHAKYFIMDRKSAFIGSLNLDPRSVIENTEIGAIILSESLANKLATDFDENIRRIAFKLKLVDNDIIWEHDFGETETVFDKEPYTTWWERFSTGFMRILPAESQL